MNFILTNRLIFFFGLISISINAKTITSDVTENLYFISSEKGVHYQNVIICSGQNANAYHSRNNCAGLNNCQAEIYTVSEYDAINKYGRKACCRCWQNVFNNCHEDNPDNIGGGSSSNFDGSAVSAFAALSVVATGAILLANEVYAAPAYSLNRPATIRDYSGIVQSVETLSSLGLAFQFRKNFTHSGLEYGAGFINYKFRNKNSFQNNTFEKQIWRINLNYVHNVFYNKFPERVIVFLGPSINYETDQSKVGFGGILGSSYRLFDRLKADIRYELTSTTHQACIGLQFLFQKKYFWKK